ncbi:MAG: CADD family putative folate metabolism protein [Deltaproteobacteria bacterium]|nr:CADD family putative folate metabolism protein [Deltaproteobacteria bacterium]MBM4317627.1 CADD family putative folate metabolism protein [Deltaproteobacteria bacterium]
MRTLRSKLEEKIQQKHLLAHPFYTAWSAGTLTQSSLQGYAKEYYAFEKEFPRFISALHSQCKDPKMRQALLENLIDEERGEKNHLELWTKFAEGLGVDRRELSQHFFSDETHHLLKVFREAMSSDSLIDGVAALYAYERQQPDVARTKVDGLKCFYGVEEESAVEFFKVHQIYDVYHAETEANLLSQLCLSEVDEERAVESVEKTLSVLYDFLDGVQRRYC